MNNTVLKIIAALLAIGAVVVAILGVRMSRQPPAQVAPVTATEPASVPTEAVVVAARPIKAGKAVGSGDVIIKNVQAPAAQAFRQTQELIGKIPLSDIQPGTPLLPTQFMADTMATLVHPGERAVSVLVDEIIGLGGFAKPGDRVDVLAYVPPNREANNRAFAQVAIHNARILAIGEASQLDVDQGKKEPSSSLIEDDAAKKGSKGRQELREFRTTLHSALLAISEADAPKLMLAANTGTLRLALRPGGLSAQADAMNSQLAGHGQRPVDPGPPRYSVTMSDIAPPRAPSRQDEADDIIIQEGSNERRLTAKEGNSSP